MIWKNKGVYHCNIISDTVNMVTSLSCTEDVNCTLFKSYCTSLYTCQLWCNYKSESIRKLCVAYNNVFRLLCNEPKNCSASYVCVTEITHLQNVDQEKCV